MVFCLTQFFDFELKAAVILFLIEIGTYEIGPYQTVLDGSGR